MRTRTSSSGRRAFPRGRVPGTHGEKAGNEYRIGRVGLTATDVRVEGGGDDPREDEDEHREDLEITSEDRPTTGFLDCCERQALAAQPVHVRLRDRSLVTSLSPFGPRGDASQG